MRQRHSTYGTRIGLLQQKVTWIAKECADLQNNTQILEKCDFSLFTFPSGDCNPVWRILYHVTCCCKRTIVNYKYFVSDRKQKNCNLQFENQLFEYIHFCTEININLLQNTCNFNRKVSVHFFVNCLREYAKMCILEKLNFKIPRGSMPPNPPSVLAPSALDPISAGLSLNCFRQIYYYQWAIVNIILRFLIKQKHVSFFH